MDSCDRRQKMVFVFGACQDKNVREMLLLLKPLARKFFFCKAKTERGLPAKELEDLARELGVKDFESAENVQKAVQKALAEAGKSAVIVTGSLFVLGEARQLFVN